jgi:hypothetical protein
MNQYIGTKIINAKPMNRLEYNQFRGWELPADEDGTDDGFLVEYVDGGAANTTEYVGYVSWSPSEVFENAYKSSGELSFGDAIKYLKVGYKVARKGWNGKGMWIAISNGNSALEADKFWNPHARDHAEKQDGFASVDPYIIMKTASGSILMGWLASQTDMLAEDWELK